jgi:pre-peptidase
MQFRIAVFLISLLACHVAAWSQGRPNRSLQPGIPTSLTLWASSPTDFLAENSFEIIVPKGATRLQVSLSWTTPDVDLDLYMRFNQKVSLDSEATGKIVGDYHSINTGSGTELITLEVPSAGTYNIGIVANRGFNVNIDATLTATVNTPSAPARSAPPKPRHLLAVTTAAKNAA